MEQIQTGMGAEVSRLKPGDATDICVETVEEGGESDERRERMRRDEVVLVLDYPDRKNCFQDVKIYAKAGESVTVWTVVRSKKDAEEKAVLRTLLQAEENAKIRLVQVDLLGDRMQLYNDIGVESGKQAQIEAVQLFLGAEKIWAGSYATLTGEKSHLQLDTGYYREKKQLLDMNYVAQHIGKKTESNMNVDGVLQDASKKVFRGTIDFPLGCVGAKGDEMEDVLILGENAINQTVPLILCAEEDVEGNHGASIGRPAGTYFDADLQAAFSKKTKLVAVTQVSNVLGIRTPIEKIDALARKSGAVVVLDAARSTPHMEVDVQKLGVDFLAFSGHKLMAPMGIGVLYGRKELLSEMPPFLTGGEMIQTVTRDKVVYAELPHKFEAGTVNGAGAWALAAAIRYLQEVGYEQIQKQELMLTTQLMDGLKKVPHVQVQGSPDPKEHCGIVSFTIDGVHPHDVSSILDADGIAVRAGHHCAQPLMQQIGVMSTARASMYFYNTEEDIEKLLASVQTIRRRMGYGE